MQLLVGRVVAVYACVGDAVDCGFAEFAAVSRVDERMIVYCDEC